MVVTAAVMGMRCHDECLPGDMLRACYISMCRARMLSGSRCGIQRFQCVACLLYKHSPLPHSVQAAQPRLGRHADRLGSSGQPLS